MDPKGKWIIRVTTERTRGLDLSCKTKVKSLPVVGAAVDGISENEWKWNTTNNNAKFECHSLNIVQYIAIILLVLLIIDLIQYINKKAGLIKMRSFPRCQFDLDLLLVDVEHRSKTWSQRVTQTSRE